MLNIKGFSFRLTLGAVFVSIVILACLIFSVISNYNNRKYATSTSDEYIDLISNRVINDTNNFLRNTHELADMSNAYVHRNVIKSRDYERMKQYFIEVLGAHKNYLYAGYANEFGIAFKSHWRTPENDRDKKKKPELVLEDYEVQFGYTTKITYTIDEEKQLVIDTVDTESNYDARNEDWYTFAFAKGEATWTSLYLFEDGTPGITLTKPIYDKKGKFAGATAIDTGITFLSKLLSDPIKGLPIDIVMFDDDGSIIAYPDSSAIVRQEEGTEEKRLSSIFETGNLAINEAIKQIGTVPEDQSEVSDLKKIVTVFDFESEGQLYRAYHNPFEIEDFVYWHVLTVVPHNYIYASATKSKENNMRTTLIALMVAATLAYFIAQRLSNSLSPLVGYMRKIGKLNLSFPVKRDSNISEIRELSRSIHSMKNSLRSFEKYVPADLVRELIRDGQEAELGGYDAELTIFFSDMVNFTQVSERFSPSELVEILGGYLGECSDVLMNRQATLDKYIGDAIMAFWGAPKKIDDHAYLGCVGALECQEVMKKVSAEISKKGVDGVSIRIGLNSGHVVAGNMGSNKRLNYTVLGDAVNLSSRLEAINKFYGTDIMMGEVTYEQVKDRVYTRIIDKIAVKGKTEGIRIYEVIGLIDIKDTLVLPIDDSMHEVIRLSDEGFNYYAEQQWDKAIAAYKKVLSIKTEDKVSQVLIERCEVYKKESPGKDWDGVFRHTSK